MPWRRSQSRSRLWLDKEPLCTRQRSRPVENGCECSVVTALSVAMRVWPMAFGERAADRIARGIACQHAMARPHLGLDPGGECRRQLVTQALPRIALVG